MDILSATYTLEYPRVASIANMFAREDRRGKPAREDRRGETGAGRQAMDSQPYSTDPSGAPMAVGLQNVFRFCCILHNWILEKDGADNIGQASERPLKRI